MTAPDPRLVSMDGAALLAALDKVLRDIAQAQLLSFEMRLEQMELVNARNAMQIETLKAEIAALKAR